MKVALAILDLLLSLIGIVVIAMLFWHWIGVTQLVVCYGRPPTCDVYEQVKP